MTHTTGSLDTIAAAPPNFDPARVAALLDRQYGLQGRLSLLVSERDQNFRLDSADGSQFVVKIANPAEPFAITDFQVRALRHLEQQNLAVAIPRVLPAKSGDLITTIGEGPGAHCLRVVSYVPGVPLEGRQPGRKVAFDMGRSLALIDIALSGFTHPGASQVLLWDMQRAAELWPLVRHVPAQSQGLVEACIEVFEARLAPAFADLRTQVIHNDLNPGNILLTDTTPPTVAGVIDFGDMLRAPLVVDVAIAASYLRRTDDELATLGAFVAGFESELALQRVERDLLYDLVKTRLAATIAILYWRAAARSADDPYLNKALEERGSERFLRHLSQLGREGFCAAVFRSKRYCKTDC